MLTFLTHWEKCKWKYLFRS